MFKSNSAELSERDVAAPSFNTRFVPAAFANKLAGYINNPPPDLAKLMKITPDAARVMLERNKSDEWENRPHSVKGLRRYVRAMKRGWKLTGEPIIFSRSGLLINGQHRLMACIEAGVPFECLVVFGVDDDAFQWMDTGIVRTAGHIFAIEGIPNYNQIAAISRIVYGYLKEQTWDGGSVEVENEQLLAFYYERENIAESVVAARAIGSSGLMPMRWAGACHYICSLKHKAQANEFFEMLATGLGITDKKSPIYVLRKRLLDNAQSTSAKLGPIHIGAFTIQAWNMTRKQAWKSGSYRWRTEASPNESFPRAA